MTSALSRRCREGGLDSDVAVEAHKAVLKHIGAGMYECVDLIAETHRDAERILFTAALAPLRAADALHLALARNARANGLVTFDLRMANAARAVGLLTIP